MGAKHKSLADEAKAAISQARHERTRRSDEAADEARVRAARSRFLPYVVGGAAVVCGYLSIVAAGEDNLAAVFGAAITAGVAAGMAIGWLLLGLYQRRVKRSEIARWRVDLAIVLITIPAYVAAGWTSAAVGWAVALALSGPTGEPGPPNAWPLLIGAALVLYPISYAFARRDRGRPSDFRGAWLAATGELYEQPRSFAVLGEFLIGLAWCIGSLFALVGVVIGAQIVFPSQLEDMTTGPEVALAFLVAWITLTAVGTVWTVRAVDRRHRAR